MRQYEVFQLRAVSLGKKVDWACLEIEVKCSRRRDEGHSRRWSVLSWD